MGRAKVIISSPANVVTKRAAARSKRTSQLAPQTDMPRHAHVGWKRDQQPGHLRGRAAHRLHEGETAFLLGRVSWGEARASPQHAALTAAQCVRRGAGPLGKCLRGDRDGSKHWWRVERRKLRAFDAREGLGLHPCSQLRAMGDAHKWARRPQVATRGGGARAETRGGCGGAMRRLFEQQKHSCAASSWNAAGAKRGGPHRRGEVLYSTR